ncbi:MAG: hypothetical protein LC799_24230, partial [Actinobacteria bacterium]|nr:hypothetical protein [Actinomycetota bacterium]
VGIPKAQAWATTPRATASFRAIRVTRKVVFPVQGCSRDLGVDPVSVGVDVVVRVVVSASAQVPVTVGSDDGGGGRDRTAHRP